MMKGSTVSILPLLSLTEVKLIVKIGNVFSWTQLRSHMCVCLFLYYAQIFIYIFHLCLYIKCISIYTHTHTHTFLRQISFEGSGISRMKAPGFTIFCCCSVMNNSHVAQSCPTPCHPLHCSTPCFPVHHQLLELA